MAVGAFGRLGAKLVDDIGMTGDEAARFIDNLDEGTARLLDENPRAVEGDPDALQNVLQQADSGGSTGVFDRIPRLGDDTADAGSSGSDDLGLIPQSTPGRVATGAAGAGLAWQGNNTLQEYFGTQQSQAAATERETQAKLVKDVMERSELSGEEKAAVVEDLAASDLLSPSTGTESGGNSGGGGGLIPDDPATIIIAVIILVLVFKYVIGEDDNLSAGGES